MGLLWTLLSHPAESMPEPICCPPLRYCAGTMPWGHPGEHHDFEPQRHDDGYLEVIGFTMTSLVSGPCPKLFLLFPSLARVGWSPWLLSWPKSPGWTSWPSSS